MHVITLGPLSIEARLLFGLIAVMVAFVVAGYLDKKKNIRLETSLWIVFLVTLIAGRITFVAQFWSQYQSDWIAMVNVRDGGFNWIVSAVIAVLLFLVIGMKKPARAKGLLLSVGAGAVVFVVSLTVMSWFKPMAEVQIPAIELRNLDQEPVVLTQFKGKPVVLNLWASWCPPCRREMPVMQAAQQQNEDIHFVFANQAETAQLVQSYLQAEGLELKNVLIDTDAQVARTIQSRGLPTTLFIDAQGKMQSYRMGELSAASLASHLKALK